jgi:microcystin-dependent protein
MPLESATYLPDLVTSNPAHSDGLNNADAHLRLIKGALKATFPNFTDVGLASTQAQIDAVTQNGATLLADAGVNFKTNNTDGFTNPSAGTLGIKTAGAVNTSIASGGISTNNVAVTNAIAATGAITSVAGFTGPGTTPIGGMIIWLTDTLPTGSGTWAWANGQAISRTTYATLFGLWGTTYGAGDGSTTFNLFNAQEVALIGKSTMGGASSPGLLASIASGLKTVLGGLWGSDTRSLATTNLPPYTPSGTIGNVVSGGTHGGTGAATSFNTTGGATAPLGDGLIAVASTFTGTAQGGASTAFGITPPSKAVNFIIRIA